MKLEISHNEIVSGLCAFLDSKGISGFDPATCQVTFKTVRGSDGQLTAILDTDPAPVAPAAPKAEKPAAAASTAQAAPAAKVEPEVAPEAPAEQPAEEPTAAPEAAAQAPAGDEENLFD